MKNYTQKEKKHLLKELEEYNEKKPKMEESKNNNNEIPRSRSKNKNKDDDIKDYKELESEGQITQENINEKIKKELKNYKEYSENKNNDENEAWKISSKLLQKRINYGKK